MSNRKQVIILIQLTMLIAFTVVACGTATSTIKSTSTPTVTPTPEDTPTPTATSLPATPVMQGNIDVGKYKLLYQCFGEGSPAVIVEAALGDRPVSSKTWARVIQGVYGTTRICIYNRASVRTSQDVAEDLHTLLGQIPLTGPSILVAHSLGGYHVRVYADLYPEDVAGIILVDTSHPDQRAAFATAYPTYSPDELPAITEGRIVDVNGAVPLSQMDGLDFNVSSEQVRQAGSLGDIPLIIISQSATNLNNWASAGFDEDDEERFSATWQSLQDDLASLSSNSTRITSENASHMIPHDDPQIIIDAILQMVQEIRAK